MAATNPITGGACAAKPRIQIREEVDPIGRVRFQRYVGTEAHLIKAGVITTDMIPATGKKRRYLSLSNRYCEEGRSTYFSATRLPDGRLSVLRRSEWWKPVDHEVAERERLENEERSEKIAGWYRGFPVRLNELMSKNAISDAAALIVEICGITRSTARRWLTGKTYPRRGLDAVEPLAEKLGVRPWWLATGEGPKTKDDLEFLR